MVMDTPKAVFRWSTLEVPEAQRRDFYSAALADSLIPMEVVCDAPGPLNAGAIFTDLGPITLFRMQGTRHRSLHGKRELAKTTGRSINLIINLSSGWRFYQRNRLLLKKGDAVLADSLLPFELDHDDYDIVNLQISETWLRQWIPSASLLVGCVIAHDAGWGRALSSFVGPLSPEVVANSSLPVQLFVDQVGGLLAQVAHEMSGHVARPSLADRALMARVQDVIVQRSGEPRLTAPDVADSLNVAPQALHSALRTCDMTFARMLMDARIEQARHLLASPLARHLTAGEIGRRCGFLDPGHFSRAIFRRTGHLPSALRPYSDGESPGRAHD